MLNQYPLLSKCLIHKGYPTQVIIFFKEKALISDKVIQRYTTAVKNICSLFDSFPLEDLSSFKRMLSLALLPPTLPGLNQGLQEGNKYDSGTCVTLSASGLT